MGTQCRDIESVLPSYLDGELAADDRLSFEHHVAYCSSCREALRAEREELERLRALLTPPAAPAGLEDRVRQALDHEDRRAARSRRRAGWSWVLPATASVAAAAALALFAYSMLERPRGAARPAPVAESLPVPAPEARAPRPVGRVGGSPDDVRAVSLAAEQHLRRRVSPPRLDQVGASVRGVASEWGGRDAYMFVFDGVPDTRGGSNQVTLHVLDARHLDLSSSDHYVVPATGTEFWVSRGLGPTTISYQDRHGTGYVFSSKDMAPSDLIRLVIAFGISDER